MFQSAPEHGCPSQLCPGVGSPARGRWRGHRAHSGSEPDSPGAAPGASRAQLIAEHPCAPRAAPELTGEHPTALGQVWMWPSTACREGSSWSAQRTHGGLECDLTPYSMSYVGKKGFFRYHRAILLLLPLSKFAAFYCRFLLRAGTEPYFFPETEWGIALQDAPIVLHISSQKKKKNRLHKGNDISGCSEWDLSCTNS